jgi:hypothetical protein
VRVSELKKIKNCFFACFFEGGHMFFSALEGTVCMYDSEQSNVSMVSRCLFE